LAIAGKEKYEQHFVFAGDFSPFYNDGIQNRLQKELFSSYGFTIKDFCEYSFVSRILKRLARNSSISVQQLLKNKSLLFPMLFNVLLHRYIRLSKKKIVKKVLKSIEPDVLLTDQSITDSNYIPEIFRKTAVQMGILVYIFSHGAAGGLHSKFSEFAFDAYDGCVVLSCSENEPNSKDRNRIILGDVSSSYPYVHFLNKLDIHDIHFLDDRKYKIGFIVGGTILTSTNGWHVMEEIIIDLSENPNVAMVLKLHPREETRIEISV